MLLLLPREAPAPLRFSPSSGLLLPCPSPPPALQLQATRRVWLREGKEVTDSSPGLQVLSNGSLHFQPSSSYVASVHSGSYSCLAAYREGRLLSPPIGIQAVLDTEYLPSVADTVTLPGNSAVLRCLLPPEVSADVLEIGRASCRERV